MEEISQKPHCRCCEKVAGVATENTELLETSGILSNDWKTNILKSETRRALDFLSTQEWMSSWYLGGGTALALSAGHRVSLDLDFFSQQETFRPSEIMGHLGKLKEWVAEVVEEGTVRGEFLGTRLSFIANPQFHPKAPFLHYGTVRILQPRDIAVMKVIAITQRGTRRDFLDLYWYARNQESLFDVLERLPVQYPSVAHDYHHILKALTYFQDAENDPEPELFFSADWREVKRYFQIEVPRVTRLLVRLDEEEKAS